MLQIRNMLILCLALVLAACSAGDSTLTGTTDPLKEGLVATNTAPTNPPPTETIQPTAPAPTDTAMPTQAPTTEAPQTSFEAATYTDEEHGFSLQYPAEWEAPALFEQQSRGTIYQSTYQGEPQMDIVVLLWDPKDDLSAFADNRKIAWEASGFSLQTEEVYNAGEGHEAMHFVVQTSTGEQAVFCFASLGEQYLQLSGSGDIARLSEICKTLRITRPNQSASNDSAMPTQAPAADAPGTSFEAASYTDEENGFSLQYPVEWDKPVLVTQQSRGTIFQSAYQGVPQLDIVVLLWDPKGDLAAYIDHRKTAWEASGFDLETEESYFAGEGHAASLFVYKTQFYQTVSCMTTIGEKYLELSGSGDIALLSEICKTLRVTAPGS